MLVKAEERSDADVGARTLWQIARVTSIRHLAASAAISTALAACLQYTTSYLLSRWSDAIGAESAQTERARAALRLYVGAAVIFACMVGVRCVTTASFFLISSKALHEQVPPLPPRAHAVGPLREVRSYSVEQRVHQV